MTVTFVLQLLCLGIASCDFANAWMQPTTAGTTTRLLLLPWKNRSFAVQSLNLEQNDSETSTTINEDETDGDVAIDSSNVEWGVSYIGGDPCGSKYNSDPFDKNPSDKPGMPDDMKARIAALAQKKLREES
eukprot:jgi/Psemu1/288750/fgenesh1_pg.288_\